MPPVPCDALALGLTLISCLMFCSKRELLLLADGSSAGIDGDAAAGLAAAAAAAVLLALSFSPHWPRWRRWALPALRLALFPALPWQTQLIAAPVSLAVDAIRVFQGSKTFRLLFFGIGLPLDLPAHLAVHTLCLALALADAPHACTLPILTGPQPASRIAVAHLIIGSLGTGGLLRYFPPNEGQVQCVAALKSFCTFVGWLVPTYFVLRRHHEAAMRWRRQPQQQASPAHGVAPAPAGVAPSEVPDGPSRGDGMGVTGGLPATCGRPQLSCGEAAVAWLLDNLFLRNALLPETTMLAWWVLAALCWIAGGLLALLTAR